MTKYTPPEIPQFFELAEMLYPEEKIKGRGVRSITLQVTEDCCMACTYCYQHHKTNNIMSFDMGKTIIDKLLNNELNNITIDNTMGIILDFIGGEPFMNIDLIDQICDYFINILIELEHPWLYHLKISICSNGLLYFTPKVQNFLYKYGQFCDLSISLDGNKELHDKCRLDLQGQGTYDRVLAAAKAHKNNFGDLPPTKMTLAPDNVMYTKDALFNLIQEGYYYIPFNCVFEPGWTYEHATILYYQLKEIADYLIDNNLYNRVNMKMFRESHFQPLSEEDNNNWCGGTDNESISIDYKGDIFPCIRYMTSSLNGKQPPLMLGNVNHGLMKTKEEQHNWELITNITRRSQSTDECFYCPVAAGCAWCSGYNYEEFGTPNKRATYICVMHQATSLANVYYWNKLYKKLDINKIFPLYLPKEKALHIISEEEYKYLANLTI